MGSFFDEYMGARSKGFYAVLWDFNFALRYFIKRFLLIKVEAFLFFTGFNWNRYSEKAKRKGNFVSITVQREVRKERKFI